MPRVGLFIPCFVDQLLPQTAVNVVKVLRRIGYDVDFPEAQTCCGQPAFNSGYWNDARPLAERFVKIFAPFEAIVCPSGSCTTMVRRFYPELLGGSALPEDAWSVCQRVYEFSEFLVNVARVTDVGAAFPYRVAYHDACHALRELHLRREPRALLGKVRGLELVEMPYSEECCGFGGTFSVKFHMISGAMGDTKAGNVEASGAEFVTSTDPSCLLQIDGMLRRRKSHVRAISLASILASTGGPNGPSESGPEREAMPAVLKGER